MAYRFSFMRSSSLFFSLVLLLFLFGIEMGMETCEAQSDVFQSGKGRIEGRVVVGKSYIPNALISAYKDNRLICKSRADSDGVFLLAHLPAGNYKIKAVTPYNDVLISKSIIVKNTDLVASNCDEFFLAHRIVNATTGKVYADTLLNHEVDSIVVHKREREMLVFGRGVLLKVYHICLGFSPTGAKHFEGDGKTPEGKYKISCKNPGSEYHKSLCISYPDKTDRDNARKAGKSPGGNVRIHGLPNGVSAHKEDYIHEDWTWGCIALTNEEIDDLYVHTKDQTPIVLLP